MVQVCWIQQIFMASTGARPNVCPQRHVVSNYGRRRTTPVFSSALAMMMYDDLWWFMMIYGSVFMDTENLGPDVFVFTFHLNLPCCLALWSSLNELQTRAEIRSYFKSDTNSTTYFRYVQHEIGKSVTSCRLHASGATWTTFFSGFGASGPYGGFQKSGYPKMDGL